MPPPPSPWQLIAQLSTVGLSFVFALVIGFGGGYWLDTWLGTKPWLSFLGFFLGLAAGVLNVYRIMLIAGPSRSAPGPSSTQDARLRASGLAGAADGRTRSAERRDAGAEHPDS